MPPHSFYSRVDGHVHHLLPSLDAFGFVGVFAAISSSLAYLSMSDQGPTSDDFKVDL